MDDSGGLLDPWDGGEGGGTVGYSSACTTINTTWLEFSWLQVFPLL